MLPSRTSLGNTQNKRTTTDSYGRLVTLYCEMESPGNCRKPLFWSLLSGIRRQLIALREKDMLAGNRAGYKQATTLVMGWHCRGVL